MVPFSLFFGLDVPILYAKPEHKEAQNKTIRGEPMEALRQHQLLKELKISKHEIDQVEFRKKAYDYAMKFVGIQCDEFKRLGVFGDWERPYLTLTKEYESDILLALAELYEKGYIYKDLKPVNWCASCETALAEAEVEYEDKTSPSIFVKFPSKKKIEGK